MEAPPPPKPKQYDWCSYVAWRWPKHKTHTKLAHARNAIMYGARGGTIFQWNHELKDWEEFESWYPNLECITCQEQIAGAGYVFDYSIPVKERRYVCHSCRWQKKSANNIAKPPDHLEIIFGEDEEDI